MEARYYNEATDAGCKSSLTSFNKSEYEFEGDSESLRVQFEGFRQASMCALQSATFHLKWSSSSTLGIPSHHGERVDSQRGHAWLRADSVQEALLVQESAQDARKIILSVG
jgi:hypothetical protein